MFKFLLLIFFILIVYLMMSRLFTGGALMSIMKTGGRASRQVRTGNQSRQAVSSIINSSTAISNTDVIKDLRLHPRSKMENNIVRELEKIMSAKFPTVNPSWLIWRGKTLELDGYNAELKLAIEVDGPHHHQWYSEEPYEKYYMRLVRDVVKNKLCKKRGVLLIRVDCRLPSRHWKNYMLSRLLDGKYISDDRFNYIMKQKFDTFRNEVMERELNLADMEMARAL